GDHFLAVRVHDFELPPGQRVNPLAADVELVGMPDIHAFGGHWVSPGFKMVIFSLRRHAELASASICPSGRVVPPATTFRLAWFANPDSVRADTWTLKQVQGDGEAMKTGQYLHPRNST